MAAQSDASVGIGVESTYGTYQAPTRWYEFTGESLKLEKNVVQGAGLRVSSKVARSGRRVVTTTQGKGDVEIECVSKGMGLLLQAALGTGASTLVSGSTYQQNFTLAAATAPSSLTVQKGVIDATGTVQAHTFRGVMVDSWELSAGNADIAKLKATLDLRDLDTAQAYVSPSYPTGGSLFHFAQGVVTIGGTVTAPTANALATGGTTVANVRDFTLAGSNKLAGDRFNFGGAGKKAKPILGLRELTGSMTIEYDSNTIRDAYIADTELAVSLTFTSTESLSTGFATMQVVLPAIKLNGDIPVANADGVVTLSVDFDVLDNLTATEPLYIVLRTADTAL